MSSLNSRKCLAWIWMTMAWLLLCGCSDYASMTPPKTFKVRGKVIWANGQPLRGGQITFHPEASASSEAFAEIEKDGTFVLATFGKDDGAMPGRYRVSLAPLSYKTGLPRQVVVLPKQYLDPRTSGLTAEVMEQETQLPEFRLN